MVEYVTQFHRTPAVRDLSLVIREQEVYGLVGESGCGKSTAALACVRYLPAGTRIEGEVNLLGQNVLTLDSRRLRELRGNRMAMVYQDPQSALNPAMQVLSQMEEILTVHEKMSAKEAHTRCLELLELVRISDSLVFISHDLSTVRYVSDYIGVVYLGMFCEYGRVSDVFDPPYHPYTEALISAIPVPDPTIQKKRINLEGSVPSSINPPQGCRFHTRCPRKIGKICEEVIPEASVAGDHLIYCHIPRQELLQNQANLG